ncbi:hypothetical protein SDC9_102365 [bioreactor metagenome]|jgi:hypothetical protein|uniref:Uncharacterized protein n=1 Tax=bioreactor metagenome TaxID=1076179 RepID=A0A645AS26_9ZZZZ|nr:hypothetical protein [Sphaerochaeta sp.]
MRTRYSQFLLLGILSLLLFFSTGCGVYSKVPAVQPEGQGWEGPLLDQADMEDIQVTVKARKNSVTLNLEELDADLPLLLTYINQAEETSSSNNELGSEYILVIAKKE